MDAVKKKKHNKMNPCKLMYYTTVQKFGICKIIIIIIIVFDISLLCSPRLDVFEYK